MLLFQVDLRDLAKVESIADKISNPKGLMSDIGQYMASSTQRKIEEGIEPGNAPLTVAYKRNDLPLRDTGRYLSSITFKADNTKAIIGTTAIQSRLIHEGGIVRPRRASKLYIPAGWKTRQMMRKYGMTPSACINNMKRAGYNIWKSKSGKALLAAPKGGKSPPFALFILKDKVRIPTRRHFYVDNVDERVIMEKVKSWIKPRR